MRTTEQGRKLITLTSLAIATALIACGGTNEPGSDSDDESEAAATTGNESSGGPSGGNQGGSAGAQGGGTTTGGEGGNDGGDGGSGEGGAGQGGAGQGGGPPPCVDNFLSETGDNSAVFHFGRITDCDSDSDSIKGLINGPADLDRFRYVGYDAPNCTIDPTLSFTQLGLDIEICVYFECGDGSSPLGECPAGSNKQKSGDLWGCCGTDAITMSPSELNCLGTPIDDMEVSIVLQSLGSGDVCTEYELEYHH